MKKTDDNEKPNKYIIGNQDFLGYEGKLYVEVSHEVFEMLLAPKRPEEEFPAGSRVLSKKELVERVKEKSGRKPRTCSKCGGAGHQANTCGKKREPQFGESDPDELPPSNS